MHGWISICYWSSILYLIFCLRLFIYVSIYYMLLYLHYSIYYSIIHRNLLYFGYLLSYLFASRRCRLVLKPYYCLYISIPIYYTTNWNRVNPPPLRSTKNCWNSKMFNFKYCIYGTTNHDRYNHIHASTWCDIRRYINIKFVMNNTF